MSQSPSLRINRPDTFAERRSSSAGLIGAILIHITIVAATLFSFAHKLDITDESTPIVPVDLVTIGDKTNIAPTVIKKVETPADQEVQTPQPDLLTPTPPPQQEKAAEKAPSDAPAPKAEAILPQKKPIPDQKKPQDDKKQKFDINNIMAMLNQQQSRAASPNGKVSNRSIKGVGAQDAMTADLVSALVSQIKPCWSPPIGAPHPEDLIVDFDLFLNKDGSVARPPQLTGNSPSDVARNPYTRAAAEAARRAIYTCAPYKLPANRYNDWQEIDPFHFDPSQMMGQ